MGKYFTQVEKLNSVGRRLMGGFSFDAVSRQLNPGEYLIGSYFNGVFRTAPWISDSNVFEYFESTSVDVEYYAIKEEEFRIYVH